MCLWCTATHLYRVTGTVDFETEAGKSELASHATVNTLKAELNPICRSLALLGAHHFLHAGRVGVEQPFTVVESKTPEYKNMQNLCKNKREVNLKWDKNTAESE